MYGYNIYTWIDVYKKMYKQQAVQTINFDSIEMYVNKMVASLIGGKGHVKSIVGELTKTVWDATLASGFDLHGKVTLSSFIRQYYRWVGRGLFI